MQEIENKRTKKLEHKKYLADNLVPEPGADIKDKSTINIRLPNGTRLLRKFHSTAKIQVILLIVIVRFHRKQHIGSV